jgi:hypothetical protein
MLSVACTGTGMACTDEASDSVKATMITLTMSILPLD